MFEREREREREREIPAGFSRVVLLVYNCAVGPSSDNQDVIGMVGVEFSSFATATCQITGPARIPVVSYYATSDELSDKSTYPYFLRVVPPDRWVHANISLSLFLFKVLSVCVCECVCVCVCPWQAISRETFKIIISSNLASRFHWRLNVELSSTAFRLPRLKRSSSSVERPR